MHPSYGRGFPYNINNYTLNEQFFDYAYQGDPNHRLMTEQEIPVEPPQEYYRNDYHGTNPPQMHQMYYDDVRYGNDGLRSPRHGSTYRYAPQESHFDYNQETEYSSHQISVDIRLSRTGFIDRHLINELERQDLSCRVRGSVVTVSGYPVDESGANGFLALVQRISRDPWASIVG